MEYEEGDRIRIEKDGNVYEGIVMPSTTKYVVVKMVSGYNCGVDPQGADITLIEKGKGRPAPKKVPDMVGAGKKLPRISILSTGGTIASKVDYRTGAVTASFTADDIVSAIPELTQIANINGRVVYNILSENMKAQYWATLAEAVAEEVRDGAEGIIIAHGTDTMMYSAAALSFMLETPVPIVFVGSQRSADRPSSDNAMNVICAAAVAVSDIAEVMVVMHDGTSDERCAIHYGTKVRKMHTSRRDAFKSINSQPLGYVDYSTRKITVNLPHKKSGGPLKLSNEMESKCALVKYTPGANPDILNYYIDSGYKGLVIEGTGLGHVSTDWIPGIAKATEKGIPVVMASQCLNGRICDRVYDTGRDVLEAGAVEAEDMLPEVALVKLMWALGQTDGYDEVVEMISRPVSHEMTECSLE